MSESAVQASEQKARLYIVRPTGHAVLAKDAKPRLIKAKSQLGALKFATSGLYSTELADAEIAAELGASGTKVEDATAEVAE